METRIPAGRASPQIAQDILPWDEARNSARQRHARNEAVSQFLREKYSDAEGLRSQSRIPFDSMEFEGVYEQSRAWFQRCRTTRPCVLPLMDWREVSLHREMAQDHPNPLYGASHLNFCVEPTYTSLPFLKNRQYLNLSKPANARPYCRTSRIVHCSFSSGSMDRLVVLRRRCS